MAVRPIDSVWLKRNLNKVFPRECDQLYGMLQLIDEAPTLTPQNEWVSVEERKKPKRGELIVYADSTAWGFRYGVCRVHGAETNFTHWMPLPEPHDRRPPEGEEDA